MSKLEATKLNIQRSFVVFMVILCLISTTRHLTETSTDINKNNVAVVKWEERFIYAKELLPIKRRGTIGYISEWDVPGVEFNEWDQEIELMLTRYTFAPLVLIKGMQPGWNVAVLRPSSFKKWLQFNTDQKFEIVPTGNGVYLIHKTGE